MDVYQFAYDYGWMIVAFFLGLIFWSRHERKARRKDRLEKADKFMKEKKLGLLN